MRQMKGLRFVVRRPYGELLANRFAVARLPTDWALSEPGATRTTGKNATATPPARAAWAPFAGPPAQGVFTLEDGGARIGRQHGRR